ncbi:MAG: nucleotidyltransferase family protein [Eubacterium sp.]|nr:nucleotidyltransferase family protein [Eubacterium sp.]
MQFKFDFEYLIHLIYCAIHNLQPEEKPENISFNEVFSLGKVHEVANIAFLSVDKLNNKPDEQLYAEWQVFYFHSVQRNARQLAEYGELTELLTDNKIRWTEAQGTITKTLYPTPDSRMMSDIDLIVDVDSLDKIEELMNSLGYEVKKIHENELNVFPENKSEIEFHTEYFSEFYKGSALRYSGALNHPFNDAVPSEENEYKYVLDITHYYLYSLLHVIKHFEYAGCGIRRILDLYYLKTKLGDSIDSEYIDSVLEKYDFTENAHKLITLSEFWFERIEPDIDLTDTIIDVLRSGNHGTTDIKLRNDLYRDAADSLSKAKRRKVKDFLFPQKEVLLEGYPELEGKNYSLFAMRLYRIKKNFTPVRIKHMFTYFGRIRKTK